jgi:hypothetical protein
MEVNPDFLAPCGLYCGVCAVYYATRDNKSIGSVRRGLRVAQGLGKIYRQATTGPSGCRFVNDIEKTLRRVSFEIDARTNHRTLESGVSMYDRTM